MPERATKRLSITLFGSEPFRWDGLAVPLGIKGVTLELLYYLIINQGLSLRREAICELLWGSASLDRQRSSLNSAVWRIGKKLPVHPGLVLRSTDASICLVVDESIDIDTRTLERCVCAALAKGEDGETEMTELAQILGCSAMGLIEIVSGDWALAERERWSSIRFRGQSVLMHWHGSQRNYEEALQIGRRIISEDPYRETVQIDVMWLYVLNGQRAQAIRQYESYAKLLRRELSVDPMLETRALYDYIRNEAAAPAIETNMKGAAFNTNIVSGLAAIETSRRAFYDMLRAQHR